MASFTKTHHNGKSNHQISSKKVIQDFKAKKLILQKRKQKNTSTLFISSQRHLNYTMLAKLIFLSNLTTSNQKKLSI